MSDKELEEYINKIEPNFDSHLEKGTIEMSDEYYNLLEEKMVRLINKNQELKKQLEESDFKIANLIMDKIELKKQLEVGEEQYNDLVEEKEKLQKQLTTHQILQRDCYVNNLKNISKIEEMETQQKEFINYLEDEIKIGTFLQPALKMILQKYREIIGGNDEK